MIDELDTDDFSLETTLDLCRDRWAEEMHTALPGKIESYDASKQMADVTPLIRRALPREDGTLASEPMPTIRAVPVIWPRTGDFFVHLPLAAGDTVLLVCCERDFARWMQTGEASDPLDVRHHHLSHAVAIPGFFPRSNPVGSSNTPSDALVIGKDGGATIRVKNAEIKIGTNASQFAALANLVKARLDTIQAAYDAHKHTGVTTGGGTSGTPDTVIGALADVAATVTKVE
jgi:hypothetical protein